MPKRPCLTCGALSDRSYCRRHRPARTGRPRPFTTGWRATKWRADVLAQSNGECVVCGTRRGVIAHHLTPIHRGGDPLGPGVALCSEHHAAAHRPPKPRW